MNILTFDLEDWFHILDHKETATADQWMSFESRIETNTGRILLLLEQKNLTATFFCLGWIAEKYPQLIREISLKHEIASHSMEHKLLYQQSRKDFVSDLGRSVKLLEDISGKKVSAYRAPGFSLTKKQQYVFEELNKLDIRIDCSVFPATRNHGGIADFPYHEPCRITGKNFDIVEFPMNTIKILGKNIVFSGGGYFRLLPYSFLRKQMSKSDYVMTYFHPRDFDPGQPMVPGLPLKRKFMSYTGLSGSFVKLEKLLSEFKFVSVGQAYGDLSKLPVVKYL
jgi:polysaccharide deacetylase family protein (PEP-CTERM system associated)